MNTNLITYLRKHAKFRHFRDVVSSQNDFRVIMIARLSFNLYTRWCETLSIPLPKEKSTPPFLNVTI
jgi:hypothetical protein